MRVGSPASSGRSRVTAAETRSTELELVEAVRAANAAFLGHLAETAPALAGRGIEFPAPIQAALSALSPAACQRLAEMPFTLFSLNFSDAAFWRLAVEDDGPRSRGDDRLAALARTAVFLAWHVVRTEPASAGVTMGMAAEVVAIYRNLPLSALDRLGVRCQSHLAPRWVARPAFWARLLAGAESRSQLELARLYGMQLLAAECLTPPQPRLGARRTRSPSFVS
jgi:hypothetical protein